MTGEGIRNLTTRESLKLRLGRAASAAALGFGVGYGIGEAINSVSPDNLPPLSTGTIAALGLGIVFGRDWNKHYKINESEKHQP